ncbi:MAG: fatty acid desaturase [Acidimicrobiales bacterium]
MALSILVLAMSLRVADHLYYRDPAPVLRLLRLAGPEGGRRSYHKKLDPVFATFPFAWAWCDLLLIGILARRVGGPVAFALAVVAAGTRLRVLQEASHIAVHGGLCRSRRWQWAISNLAAQWPCFRPDMARRFVAHVREHHAHPNEIGNDPNLARFVAAGVLPGISRRRLVAKLWRPLTPRGLAETLGACWTNALHGDRARTTILLRLAAVAAAATTMWWTAGTPGLLAAYVVPLLTVYPFFSWVSVLAEHRWFVAVAPAGRRARECVNGRPTDYRGLGRLAKYTIFPFTDHHHLAHSLYPSLRWNYLKAVDAALKERDPLYGRFASVNLWHQSGGQPSALSELFDRLTTPEHPDLAQWARDLAGRERAPAGEPPLVAAG